MVILLFIFTGRWKTCLLSVINQIFCPCTKSTFVIFKKCLLYIRPLQIDLENKVLHKESLIGRAKTSN